MKLKLAETSADYGDVVPRRDHDKLDASFKVSLMQSIAFVWLQLLLGLSIVINR